MIKKKRDGIKAIKEWCVNDGWVEDQYGNFKKTDSNENSVRIKLGKNSARYEIKDPFGWKRIKTVFYSKFFIDDNGKSQGWVR